MLDSPEAGPVVAKLRGAGVVSLGFGCIVVSEIEAPNMLVNLV